LVFLPFASSSSFYPLQPQKPFNAEAAKIAEPEQEVLELCFFFALRLAISALNGFAASIDLLPVRPLVPK
jgi:hypothetical protein